MGIRDKNTTTSKSSSSSKTNIVDRISIQSGPQPGFTLEDSDFDLQLQNLKKQAVILLFGEPGEGKTSFITRYAPEPVALFNFDGRGGPAIEEARRMKRKILPVDVRYPSNLSKMDSDQARSIARNTLDKFMRNLEISARESMRGRVKTIGIDTGTELGNIITTSVTGTKVAIKGDFGRSRDLVNQQWWTIFDMVRESDAHLVVLARGKEIWEGQKPSGRSTYRGPKVLNEAVDFSAWIRLSGSKGIKKKKRSSKSFEIEITKGGTNIVELGEVYTEEDWEDVGPFAYTCSMMYKDSSIEDWI